MLHIESKSVCVHTACSRPRRMVAAQAFKITDGAKLNITCTQDSFLIGTGAQCDLLLQGPNVAEKHAVIKQQRKQVFCTALVGEEVWDDSATWVNGQPLRPGVNYLLGTGAKLSFGDEAHTYTITFEEASGSNPMMEMLVKGMAGNASPEVKKQLNM